VHFLYSRQITYVSRRQASALADGGVNLLSGCHDGSVHVSPCGETQTMSHVVESCPLTKLNGGLSRLHSADEDAVLWLTSYGS